MILIVHLLVTIIIQYNIYFNGDGPIFKDQEVRSQKATALGGIIDLF